MKKCGTCNHTKPLTEFYIQRSRNAPQSHCKACAKAKTIAWQKANPDRLRQHQEAYAKRHAADRAASTAAWYAQNKERNHANAAAWYRQHPERGAAKTAKHRAAIRNAAPCWRNDRLIEAAYELAALKSKQGTEWSVDHIVPLISDRVCGLHVENNLRVIPAVLNSTKGNRIWPGM